MTLFIYNVYNLLFFVFVLLIKTKNVLLAKAPSTRSFFHQILPTHVVYKRPYVKIFYNYQGNKTLLKIIYTPFRVGSLSPELCERISVQIKRRRWTTKSWSIVGTFTSISGIAIRTAIGQQLWTWGMAPYNIVPKDRISMRCKKVEL